MKIKTFLSTLCVVLLAMASHADISKPPKPLETQNNLTGATTTGGLENIMPKPISQLFQWPQPGSTTETNKINPETPEVGFARVECLAWLKKVLNFDWNPPFNVETVFYKAEFDGRDVVRMSWNYQDYRVEVSQTYTLLAIKLIPLNQQSIANDPIQKRDAVRNMCLRIFNHQGSRADITNWENPMHRIAITNMPQLIAAWSAMESSQPPSMRDGVIYYGPTQEEEQLSKRSSNNDANETGLKEIPWEKTAQPLLFWFRHVFWWSDGKQICYYFEKTEGTQMRGFPDKPCFDNPIDRLFISLNPGRPNDSKDKENPTSR